MNPRKILNDDNAVSPVIGVILMVAITVILAAVIASFVLGMGPDTATTPTATFSSEQDSSSDELAITMESGKTIDVSNIEITYDIPAGHQMNNEDGNDVSNQNWDEATTDSVSEVTAGSTVTLQFGGSFSAGDDYTVRLVYVEGDTTSTLQTFEGTY